MPHSIRRVCLWILLLLTPAGLFVNQPIAVAQATPITYTNPLAYVGQDNGLYITSVDGTRATLIASAPPTTYENIPNLLSAPHWSPDGTKLAFIDQRFNFEEDAKLYRVDSGGAPKVVITASQLEQRALAWSWDGKQIAYIRPAASIGTELHIVQSDGTDDQIVAPVGGWWTADGGNPEDVERIVAEEHDEIFYAGTYTLQWIANRLLLSMYGDGPTMLLSSGGKVIWQSQWAMGKLIVSPDQTRAVFGNYVYDDQKQSWSTQPIMIDLADGHELPLAIPSGTKPLAWTNDSKSILYSTTMLLHESQETEVYETHEDYMLTLWRQGLNEKQGTKLFQHSGYDFGTVVVSPDNSTIVFTLIVNNIFDKLNPPVQLVAVPLNGGPANWIAIGGKPAFGKGPFTAIPATPINPAQPKNCPQSLPSRLQIGQRAKVTPGTANRLRTHPVDGAVMNGLPAGTVVLILSGPVCASDGLAWWKVNYHGAVGWTAEGDSKSYWLEQ